MLFVFYAQPLSLAAHTAGAALSSILKSLYPKLFVSLKKTKKILMEKKGYWLRRDKRSMLSKGYRLRIGYWYLFFEGCAEKKIRARIFSWLLFGIPSR